MQFLYFIAEKKPGQISLEFLQSIGLGHAFDAKPICREVEHGKGPEGKPGCTIGRLEAGLGYYSNRQRWAPLAGQEGVWVGYYPDALPTPREMVRPTWLNPAVDSELAVNPALLVVDSHILHVGPHYWPIPIARAWSLVDREIRWSRSLPRSLEYGVDPDSGEKGFRAGDVIDQFLRLEEIAEVVQEHRHLGELPDDYNELAAEVLSLSYYIGPQEMAVLGLIDSRPRTAADLLWLVIDEPGLDEIVKKKADLEFSNTTSGDAA